jgi:DNA-directed RNA polymerase specialized sigma24 family protein
MYAEVVHDALNDLPLDEAEAVKLLVMEQLPMREVRERTGASPKQLRARRDRGLATLRGELDSWA